VISSFFTQNKGGSGSPGPYPGFATDLSRSRKECHVFHHSENFGCKLQMYDQNLETVLTRDRNVPYPNYASFKIAK